MTDRGGNNALISKNQTKDPKPDLDKSIDLFEIDPSMIEVDLDDKGPVPGIKKCDKKDSSGDKLAEKDGLLPDGEEKEEQKGFAAKVKEGVKKFLEFKKGIVFFTYETENFDQFEDDIGQPPKKNVSLVNKAKFYLKILLFIAIFFGIIKQYIDVLGTEKSQSLKYYMHTDLTYAIDKVPRLFPAHQFTFISKEDALSRMKCKIANNEAECKKIEKLRCLAKGETTQAFEHCMIRMNQLLQQNATEFCVNHYNTLDLWKDEMDPRYALYHQRKHDCYQFSGIPKGRQYCLDMRQYSVGWTRESLYNCYRKYSVDFATEYCNSIFQKSGEMTDEQKKQLLQCYGQKGVPKGKDFCDLEFPGTDRAAVNNQIKCYDGNFVKSKGVCDAKEGFYYWQPSKLRQCYQAAGYVLDKAFCDTWYPLKSQIDNRYVCYTKLNLPITRDRQYCELKNPVDYIEKYKCVVELYCEKQSPPKDSTGYTNCVAQFKVKVDEPISKGGDFCYQKYFWENEYDKLYTCLDKQGFKKDSSYCLQKYHYLIEQELFKPKNEQTGLDALKDEEWTCLKQHWTSVPENQKDCAQKIASGGETRLIYPAIPKSDLTIESSDTDTTVINNPGDKTLLQQTYFAGGAVKFWNNKKSAKEAGYIVAGNYPDIGQTLKYGQLHYYLFAPRSDKDLFGPSAKTLPAGKTTFPVLNTDYNVLNGDNTADSKTVQEKLSGIVSKASWYFINVNQIMVEFENKETYEVQYMLDDNSLSIKDKDGETVKYALDNSDPNYQVFAVQNFGQNLQTKIGSAVQDGESAPNLECSFIKGTTEKLSSIKYKFAKQFVQKVKIFNFKNGDKTSLLENAEILVGTTPCAKVGPSPPVNEFITLTCETKVRNVFSKDYDPTAPPFAGIEGDYIEIKAETAGILTICDIEIFAGQEDKSALENIKKCEESQKLCDSIQNAEDKFNCWEYFGKPKTPEFCISLRRALDYSDKTSEQPKFYYSRRFKYECLSNPANSFGAVSLPYEVNECLNLYYSNDVEQCLYKYEKQYSNKMGFDEEMKTYKPVGDNIAALREAERLKKQQEEYETRSGLSIQVPLDTQNANEITTDDISKYFCNDWTKMKFYSNPYLESANLATGNFIELGLSCEVFEFYDSVKKEDQIVLHYYLDSNPPNTNNTQIEEIKDKLFINRTELNEQFFQMSFDKNLEFLEIQKIIMYMREQNPQNEELDIPSITDQDKFNLFKQENVTLKMYETESFNVSVDRVQDTTIDSAPQKNSYLAMPTIGGKQVLGYPISFGDYEEEIMKFTPENDLRMIFKMDVEDIDTFSTLSVMLNFRFTFTEQVFEYQYFSIKDLLSDIGGVGGAVTAALGSFGVYLIMIFIVDLIYIIKQKYKQEKRTHNIKIYGRKLKLYKEVINAKKGVEGNQLEGGKKEGEEKKLTEAEQLDADLKTVDRLMHQIDPEYDHFANEDHQEDKDIDLDQLLDQQEQDLLDLEDRHGKSYQQFNIKYQPDIFDDLVVTKKLYSERTRYKFMKIAELIKKRISFFGIYTLNDQVEMTQEKLGHMRKQLQVTFRLLLEHQNKLLTNFKIERKENVENIEKKFSEVKKRLESKKKN